ncbi:MAG: gliding motility-associated C-terminal domain-containing protein [Bacteroidales bacterium]
MARKTKHTNTEPDTKNIDRHAKGDSFKTPEHYFEEFSSKIVSMTKDVPVKPNKTPLYKNTTARPWTMAAAAAAIIGLVVASVIYFTDNSQQIDNVQQDQEWAQADTIQTEKQQKTYDSSRQAVAEKDEKDTKKIKTKDLAISKQHPDTPKIKRQPERETALAQEKEKKLREQDQTREHTGNETDTQLAENQQQGKNQHSQAISQQSSDGNKTSNEEVSIASEQVSQEMDFYNDTCISSPSWFDLPSVPKGYKIAWANSDDNDSLLIEESGVYSAVLTDINNDTVSIHDFEVQYLPEPEVKLRRQYKVCINKNLKLDPGFYDEQYEFQWSDGVESPVNFVSEISATTKVYSLKIKGCETYKYETKVIFESCDLTIPNVITPNGDGINDYFKIEGLENYPGSKLIILDRNGKELYVDENYQNDFDGNNLPEGSYYYILQVNDKHQTTKKGNLNIIY